MEDGSEIFLSCWVDGWVGATVDEGGAHVEVGVMCGLDESIVVLLRFGIGLLLSVRVCLRTGPQDCKSWFTAFQVCFQQSGCAAVCG